MKLFQAANGEPVSLDRLRDVGVELIAVTTRPGMGGSLDTGLRFAQVWSLDIFQLSNDKDNGLSAND